MRRFTLPSLPNGFPTRELPTPIVLAPRLNRQSAPSRAPVDASVQDRPAVSTFAALKVRNYRLYFFGQGISVAGNWMQNVAIGWLVLQLTHSGVILGIVTAARFVPLLVLGPWGGLVVDRSNTLRLLTLTQTCAAAVSLVLAVLSWTGHVPLAALIAIVLALGVINVFDGPARQSLIGNLVERDLLGNAIALNSIAINTARSVGPGLGGALIATLGMTPCFFANAFSFVAVIVSLLAMRQSELVPSQREPRARGQIRAGLRYVRRTPHLFAPLIMVTITGAFAWEFPVTLPVITSQAFHGDAATYGTAMSCVGVGAIVGGVVAARRRVLGVRSLAMSAILWGALIVGASAAPTLPLEYASLVLVGSAAVTFNSAAKTLLQVETAMNMRGRVMSLWSTAWQGSTVVGAPIIGFAGHAFGPRAGLVVGGAMSVLAGALFLRRDGKYAVVADDSDPSPPALDED